MTASRMGCSWYRYEQMDGQALVDEEDGELLGYVLFTLSRPETHIRQIVVHPEHQYHGMVARRLLTALARLALAHGSEGIEGFSSDEQPHLEDLWGRLGAVVQPGVRLRWPLVPAAQTKAQRWMETVH